MTVGTSPIGLLPIGSAGAGIDLSSESSVSSQSSSSSSLSSVSSSSGKGDAPKPSGKAIEGDLFCGIT